MKLAEVSVRRSIFAAMLILALMVFGAFSFPKIGVELEWRYDWDRPLDPWTVRSPDGSVDLRLDPIHDKHTAIDAVVAGTETHQVFGRWSGTVVPDDGPALVLEGIQGFAEESRSRW